MIMNIFTRIEIPTGDYLINIWSIRKVSIIGTGIVIHVLMSKIHLVMVYGILVLYVLRLR